MSDFICEFCQTEILEDENGFYVTGCIHYPIGNCKKVKLDNIFKEVNEEDK